MRTKLSKKLVADLEPKSAMYEVCDETIHNLRLRIFPSGIKTYCVVYRTKAGRRRRYTLGDVRELTITQARDEAIKRLGEVAQGKDPSEELKAQREAEKAVEREYTLADIIDLYDPWVTANRKSGEGTVRRMRSSFKPLLSRKVSTLDIVAFDKHRSNRLKKPLKGKKKPPSPEGVERDLAVLRSMFNWAIKRGYLESNPVAGMERLKHDKEKPMRFLTDEEETRLYDALQARDAEVRDRRESFNKWRADRGYETYPPLPKPFCDHVEPAIRLALATGMRRAELLGLEWADVNLGEGVIVVRGERAKSGKTRHVPIGASIVTMLEQWRGQHGENTRYLFPNEDGEPMHDIRSSFDAVLKKAKIKGFRFHDLRHSFASKLVRRKVDLYQVSKLLGHASISTTERYAHLAPDTLREAVAMLEDKKPAGEIIPFEQKA